MKDFDYEIALGVMEQAAQQASQEIMTFYRQQDMDINRKADKSPVTAADLASDRCIRAVLNGAYPDIPVLSEEGGLPGWSQRQGWQRYWLVDPLDGTSQFIRHRPQFVVSIALVEAGVAVLGVIAHPVEAKVFAGYRPGDDRQSWWAQSVDSDGRQVALSTRRITDGKPVNEDLPFRVILSGRFSPGEPETLLTVLKKGLGPVVQGRLSSALKFCRVAEGLADFYPCILPTSEWDSAAGQALVEAAGGAVFDSDGSPRRYNTGQSLLNPAFYVVGDNQIPWPQLLHGIEYD